MNITAFNFIGTTIDNITNAFVIDGVSGLISGISPLIVTAVTLYIMFKGYMMMFGNTEDLARDGIITGIQIITITLLTLNVGNYTHYIIGGINAFAGGLSNAIGGNESGDNIYQALDSLLTQGVDEAVYCFEKIGMFNGWVWFFVAIVILIVVMALTVLSAIIIIGSKFLLSVLFVIGPLFITLAIFPITRKFFDSWVGKVVEHMLVQIFGVAIIVMALRTTSHFIGQNSISADNINPMAVMTQIAVVTSILAWVVRQVPNLSGSLAGGFASGVLTFKDAATPINKLLNGKKEGNKSNSPKKASWDEQQANQVRGGGANSTPQQTKSSQAIHDKIASHNRQ
ncbi:type IV secretion system protein VirB6 [Aliivibrio fischeri]|uniref:type IV secretion system protein n=1 Tax=Aliivibrio fischeri TaxID=668 RepID=UPI0012D94D85|nr:type IV secretion system protein [Aliivibrio fischeri]MUK76548.1 type IV secretion system protein VirB6 [Aliivibrio fischeri]